MKNKKLIIAFDGPDNVGKGTQMARLRKWLSHIPFVITNLDRPHGETHEEKIHYGLCASKNHIHAQHLLWKQEIPQLVDRMHYTEYAYSVLRGGHDIETILNMEQDFIDMKDDFLTIIFIDDVHQIQNRDDGLSYYNAENQDHIRLIIERFKEIAQKSLFNNIIINIQGKDIDTVEKEVQSKIREQFPYIFT